MDTYRRFFDMDNGGAMEQPESSSTQRRPVSALRRKSGKLPILFALLLLNGLIWPFAYVYMNGAPAPGAPPPGQGGTTAAGGSFLGFDVSNATIPKEEILRGGPPKDGIPAILEPEFLPVKRAEYLDDSDSVVGLVHGDFARAYPLKILVWHEIVNDSLGDLPVAVTYCPLCGTCMVFDRRAGGKERTFGVSGLLHNSDVLMYDHQTESLWSQLKMEAVSGEEVGQKLTWLASEQMTWKAWKEKYPGGEVLSTDTGFNREYGRSPYTGYETNNSLMFPVPISRGELPLKAWVVGTIVNGVPKAYARHALGALPGGVLNDTVGGIPVRVEYDPETHLATVTREDGTAVPIVNVYWFAWQGFYPNTELFANTPESE